MFYRQAIVSCVSALAFVFASANVHAVTIFDVPNGDFESGTLGESVTEEWRFFAVAGATGSAIYSDDAFEGNLAALLTRDNTSGDTALDKWDDRIVVTGGATVRLSLAAKAVSDPLATYLRVGIVEFDSNGDIPAEEAFLINPGSDYDVFVLPDYTLTNDTTAISIAFRVVDSDNQDFAGSVLIDSVAFIPEPASLVLMGLGGLLMLRRHRA